MLVFPNCKINLGLRVTGKRPDGYHNIETIFYPVNLRDAAELIVTQTFSANRTDLFELNNTGITIPGENSGNLCTKAWQLIRQHHAEEISLLPEGSLIRMFLHKTIPIGAGLGGGSADGAYTLLLLNNELKLNLSAEQLKQYALELGSDCPFFILNKPCLATGRGEMMEELELSLDDYYFTLVDTGIHVSTAWAFGHITLSAHSIALSEIIRQPVEQWKDNLLNDFEKPVFEVHPVLKEIKEELYRSGAAYASMTGSGSCVYGLFNKKNKAADLHMPASYKVYILK